MLSRIGILVAFFGLLLWNSGCANLVETRAITSFTEALAEENLAQVKETASPKFEQKALRLADSLDDLKILRLPTGESSIVKVQDESENEKSVVVEAGKQKRTLLYKLKRKPDSKDWVVDDIFIRQRQDGVMASKSVTEQMDLLLTVREFLSVWEGASSTREEVLKVLTPELRGLLSSLPPSALAQLGEQVLGGRSSKMKFKPEAQIDDDSAIVRLPRATGTLVMSIKMIGGVWKVDDLAIDARSTEERVVSIRRHASVIRGATAFLDAYKTNQKEKLKANCSKTFYNESLSYADLSFVTLPSADLLQDAYRVTVRKQFADFVIETPDEVVKMSLVQQGDSVVASSPYLVEDVTIYEVNGSQQKRLSALFTAHATMHIFAEALATRNLPAIRHSSTSDFTHRVWQLLTEETLHEFPLTEVEPARPEILKSTFRGSITEIEVQQGSQILTYQLYDRNGEVLVDDVFINLSGRPKSLKANLELLIPIHEFHAGIRLQNIDLLQTVSAQDFNRLVWHQTKQIPEVGRAIPEHLSAPLTSLELRADYNQAIATYGDENWGAKVLLEREASRYVIGEMLLIAGPGEALQTRVKRAMKNELAEGMLNRASAVR